MPTEKKKKPTEIAVYTPGRREAAGMDTSVWRGLARYGGLKEEKTGV